MLNDIQSTLSNFSTNVQLACAIKAGLISAESLV